MALNQTISFVLIGIALAMTIEYVYANTIAKEAEDGLCHCGVFIKGEDTVTGKPLIEKSSQTKMPSNDEGRFGCAQLCISFASAAKDDAPKVICNAVKKDVKDLTVSVYSRLCKENWQSTGKSSKPICCKDGLPIECKPQTVPV